MKSLGMSVGFGKAFCSRAALLASLFGALMSASSGHAQQPQQEQTPESSTLQLPRRTSTPPPDVPLKSQPLVSDLTRENLNRVAASTQQIKAILILEPGLIVELKRWIAKDASDNGQVIADEDLTDDAIYARLANDVQFRSVATRLVQRYGYLRPGLNPESSLGKEEDYVLKERARKLVEVETQDDQEEAQERREERRAERQAARCQQQYAYDQNGNVLDSILQPAACADLGNTPLNNNRVGPTYNAPRNDQLSTPPDQNISPNAGGAAILRAQAGMNDSLVAGGGLSEGASSLRSISDPMSVGGGGSADALSASAGGLSSGQFDMTSLDPNRLAALQGALGGQQDLSSANGKSYRYDAASSTGRYPDSTGLYRNPRGPRSREFAPADIIHTSNPYADIPSLYDLYVQAPSRTGTPQRFGAEVFRDGLRNLRALPMDLPVGPDYVVGPGDSLSIDMWGGVSNRFTRSVDREGRVSLPEAGPLQVSGRTLGDVQQLVQKALSSQYRDTSADVSVSKLRTVRVYVVGEVGEPGAYDISSLSTALNALVSAGGVTQRGSLRNLKHFHGRQLIEEVDAYDLLLRGVTPDAKKLDNGDTLMVPPIGPQVTITGMVRRPAVYELRDETSLADALELAGGILPAATLKHVEVQRLDAHEKRTMLSLDLSADNGTSPELASFKVKDGDEIHIFPIAPYNQDTIYLQGHVLRPGKYSYRDRMKLTDLVASYKDLLPEPSAHYGEIIRLNAPDYRPTVVSFDLESALKDPTSAPPLQPLDTVRIFGRYDFEPAPVVSVGGEVRMPGTYRTSGQASLRDAVFLAGGLGPNASLDNAQLFRVNADGTAEIFSVNLREAMNGNAADNILLKPRDRLLIHRNAQGVDAGTVEITGEVAKPGRYPYTGNMRALDLILAAGGLKRSADPNTADLTRYAASSGVGDHTQISLAAIANGNATEDVRLSGGDVLAIRQKPGWKDVGAAVKVSGEVAHPSTYGIQPGERLSSVLARAGGYTANAYPYGALLTRRDIREIEQKSQADLITRIKSERVSLKALPENDQDQKNAKLTAISETDSALTELATREPVGRVVIHIKKDVSEWQGTEADITLRDGDELFIPKNPNTILVTGQVFNPTAISQQPGRSANWYLSQAGGLTPMADKKAVFVIRGDGSVISAKNNGSGWFNGDPMSATLRPGDAIVVPEKAPKIGGPNWTTALQAAQIASSIALVVAYIHP
jgi:protein involved in polysaccharide export with SLBB domain/type II secretory pathway pseudopilin PulG